MWSVHREYLFSAPDSLADLPVMEFLDYELRNDTRYREDLQSVVRDGGIFDFCAVGNSVSLEVILLYSAVVPL